MTVEEFIAKLQVYPPGTLVYSHDGTERGACLGEVEEPSLVEIHVVKGNHGRIVIEGYNGPLYGGPMKGLKALLI